MHWCNITRHPLGRQSSSPCYESSKISTLYFTLVLIFPRKSVESFDCGTAVRLRLAAHSAACYARIINIINVPPRYVRTQLTRIHTHTTAGSTLTRAMPPHALCVGACLRCGEHLAVRYTTAEGGGSWPASELPLRTRTRR